MKNYNFQLIIFQLVLNEIHKKFKKISKLFKNY